MTSLFPEWPEKDEGGEYTPVQTCHHRMDPVPLLDGTILYASANHAKREDDELRPDFGFYLDSIWKPDCIAFYTYWQDFGLPTLPLETFVELLELVLEYAQDWAVEVGCIGGHGRTGTALACMAVLTGDTPITAVERIRALYCDRCVETKQQEWLVEAVYAHKEGLEIPEKPPEPVFKSSYGDYSWKTKGNGEKGAEKGRTSKIKTDATGQEYCAVCCVDIPNPAITVCIWCEATLVKGETDDYVE